MGYEDELRWGWETIFIEPPSQTTPSRTLTSGVRPHAATARASERARVLRRSGCCSREKIANEMLCRNLGSCLSVHPRAMLACVTAPAAVSAVLWMARRLSSSAMDQVEGTINDGAARCAVGWKASPSARRVCLELPWRGPGPFVVYHQCARLVQAGSHPPQFTAAADPYSLDGIWAASTDISVLLVVSVVRSMDTG